MKRTVLCAKFQAEKQGLDNPPFKGPIGQLIYDRVSQEAWAQWRDDMQIKVLNEYRLNMGDPNDYAVLVKQMCLCAKFPLKSVLLSLLMFSGSSMLNNVSSALLHFDSWIRLPLHNSYNATEFL